MAAAGTDEHTPANGARGESLSSVGNALRLLKEFANTQTDLGVTELAKALGISKSTTHRLLTTLTQENLLERDEVSNRYRLGVVVYELGMAVPLHRNLHEAAAPIMEAIRARTGDAVYIGVVRGHELFVVDKLNSEFTRQVFRRSRNKNLIHCTATGKAVVADYGPDEVENVLHEWRMPRRTPKTITDPQDFRAELDKVRRVGYATDFEESDVGVAAIGAAIRSPHGRAIAAMTIIAPVEKMTPTVVHNHARMVVEAARALSKRLASGPLAG